MAKTTEGLADAGMIGLGVMGRSLALNMADHGFRVAVYNRDASVTDRMLAEHPDTPGGLVGCRGPRELAAALRPPRLVVLLIKAGPPVDSVIGQLAPHLERGDLIVDGGNSLFTDTARRERELAERGLRFVGSGVSGGEEGARFGPSLMPGGHREAWPILEPVWTAIAAKVDPKSGKPLTGATPGRPVEGGLPCTAWIGPGGAGHYVKMVHNGIEYGDMQLIAEAYHLLRELGGLAPDAMAEVFSDWNHGELDSFLVEITADILRQRDPVGRRRPFVDAVLDAAGQKGTGKWTSASALDLGVPAPTIAEAVFARFLSALKEERVRASRLLGRARRPGPKRPPRGLVEAVRDALYGSKICSYAQGFALMAAAGAEHGFELDYGTIASIWRGGCIIRARFLQKITDAYRRDPQLANLLLDPFFRRKLRECAPGWRKVVARAAEAGVPAPAFMSALAYFDAYRSARLPANLIQAQRDYFGAHTFERIDRPRGKFFHVEWLDPKRPIREA